MIETLGISERALQERQHPYCAGTGDLIDAPMSINSVTRNVRHGNNSLALQIVDMVWRASEQTCNT
jgi:hypothetical protein